jgi:hypothetical protein
MGGETAGDNRMTEKENVSSENELLPDRNVSASEFSLPKENLEMPHLFFNNIFSDFRLPIFLSQVIE